MIKVFVTDNKSKNVSAAIISGLKRQVNELNSAEYNYADILKSVTLFKEYSRLLSAYFGIEVNITFDIQHSSKVKVNTINNTVPRVRINDLNAALRSNYDMLIQIVGQIESIYNKAYEGYKSMIALYDAERLEYNDFRGDAASEIDSLTEALNNTEIITEEEITEAINEAQAETEAQIEETEVSVDNTAQEVWDTNKGYETASQIQEDAIKAAEEYAENKAHDNAAAEAGASVKAAQEEADRAQAELDKANDEFEKANEAYVKATDDKEAARADYDQATANQTAAEAAFTGAQSATNMAVEGLPAPGTSKAEIDPISGGTTVVTANADGTYTVSYVSADGSSSSTRTYDDASAFDRGGGTMSPAMSSTSQEYQQATQAVAEAEGKYNDASAKWDESLDNKLDAQAKLEAAEKTVTDAQTKVDAAQQAADDANIPYATDDELENGWQNDPDNPSDDDYGEDNWGDWSDIIGEGIEDGGDEDDSEDTED